MSTTFAAVGGVRPLLRWILALLLLATSHVALAAYCTSPKSATINAGGSVTFDVSDCDGPSNTGMTDDGVPPAHGSYVLSGQSGPGTQTVTYTNNGDGATSDSFYLLDEDNNQVVFNITINPAISASIAVSPSSANEDSGTSFTYTVTLSQTSSSATTVNLTRSGTATSGTDYTGAVASIVVPANTASASFAITPVADTTVEADETVVISVASGSGYGIGSPSSATATIVNDDFPNASIAVAPSSVAEDGATNLIYTVTLDQAAPSAVSVAFSVGGTATSGTDYAAVSSPLVIAAGQTTGTITINPTADSTIEPDETVVLTLASGTTLFALDLLPVGAHRLRIGRRLRGEHMRVSTYELVAERGDHVGAGQQRRDRYRCRRAAAARIRRALDRIAGFVGRARMKDHAAADGEAQRGYASGQYPARDRVRTVVHAFSRLA